MTGWDTKFGGFGGANKAEETGIPAPEEVVLLSNGVDGEEYSHEESWNHMHDAEAKLRDGSQRDEDGQSSYCASRIEQEEEHN